ncbi:MAG TPA: hypothetical protein VMJ90_06400 [Anaerolineales bacterium]|nr:hypothetical protein [Anaerolineales bacterium]
MKFKHGALFILILLTIVSCTSSAGSESASTSPAPAGSPTGVPLTDTPASPSPTLTATSLPTDTPAPTDTATVTPIPTVESLEATVTAELLSCRYGPGPEYLYLFAFRRTANIKLIGRVDAENWKWALVENDVPCWVHTDFIEIAGDFNSLPIVYPGVARLPITPYYPRSEVLSAERNQETNEITISWLPVPISAGDYEDETMQQYLVEIWRCEDGQLIFDPLATNFTFITFVDEPGCSEPSHGQVWVQEKHGYAGPAEIPWPGP